MKPTPVRLVFAAAALATFGIPSRARADEAKDFVTRHLTDVVKTDLVQISDPAVLKTFAAPVFTVTITFSDSDGGTQSTALIVARSGDKVVPVSRPGTDGDYPQIQKLFNPDLKLTSDDVAKTVQDGIDLVFPIIGNDDKAARGFTHSGNQWTFARGFFMAGAKLGFVLTTDANGAVTDVKFALKLP